MGWTEVMSVAVLTTVEEFLRSSKKPTGEYRDGVVTAKARPTKPHAIVQFALQVLLRAQGWRAYAEVTVRISERMYLVPDVIAGDAFPGSYPTEPVRLCCEILSPGDRLGAMLAKCEDYHAWGVPYCWVIDPEKRTAWEYHSGSEPVRVATALSAGDVAVPLDALFAELD